MMQKNKQFLWGILFLAVTPFYTFAQTDSTGTNDPATVKVAPNDWHELDRATTGYYGISLDKAYDFLKGKSSKTIVVAVIDSGVDTTHEDLKGILWHNPGEIPGNGIDDDHNGYVDDVYGWNFIGGKDGRAVHQDSYEAARVYWSLKSKYDSTANTDTTKMDDDQKMDYATYLRAKNDVTKGVNEAELLQMKRILPMLEEGDSVIGKDLGKSEFTGKDLKDYKPTNPQAKMTTAIYLNIAQLNNNYDITNTDLLSELKGEIRKGDAAATPPEDFRNEIVKDNPNDINDRNYGNNDVMSG
ncbi:MAG TPA: peptidase S8, partial [Hanamia sp.]